MAWQLRDLGCCTHLRLRDLLLAVAVAIVHLDTLATARFAKQPLHLQPHGTFVSSQAKWTSGRWAFISNNCWRGMGEMPHQHTKLNGLFLWHAGGEANRPDGPLHQAGGGGEGG